MRNKPLPIVLAILAVARFNLALGQSPVPWSSLTPSVQAEALAAIRVRLAPISQALAARGHDSLVIAHSDLHFTAVPSRQLRGVRYVWATYQPARLIDGRFWALVVTKDGEASGARSAQEFMTRLVRSRQERAADKIALCSELVRAYSVRADPLHWVRIFRSDTDLSVVLDPGKAEIRARGLHPPFVYPSGQAAAPVYLWAIESGQTTRYRCAPFEKGPPLFVVDSIPGIGLPPSSP